MNKQELIGRISSVPTIKLHRECLSSTRDNLAIALATYFERHEDRPHDDPPSPQNESWGKWVIEKTEDMLERIAAEVLQNPQGQTTRKD